MDRTHTELPTRHLRGTGELLQAVPYLLGFHPRDSLVLVGLADGVLVVTSRLDLTDVPHVVNHTVEVMVRGGCTGVFAAIYAQRPVVKQLPVARAVLRAAGEHGCQLLEAVLCEDQRWWSVGCSSESCCPPEGQPIPTEPSAFTTAATFDGVVALADRAELAMQFEPHREAGLSVRDEVIAEAEHDAVRAALDAGFERHERSVKRALFAAARAAQEPADGGWKADDQTVARFGVALGATAVRDSVWLAIDDGRLDGRPLWLELGRRLPPPYSAAPLFLYAWASWRSGNATLAGMAVERALHCDPGYSAAELLVAALGHGMDPRRVPRLRSRRAG